MKRGLLPFNKTRLLLSSPEQIISWSHGEVKRPETLNYRTLKPEKEGLFCAKIFGPLKDYECLCGKYKGKRFEGTICDRCGVEVTKAYVRRERFGHITLATPCAHIWFLKSSPSKIGALLGLSARDIEKVIYFESYLVVEYPTPDMETTFANSESTIPVFKDDITHHVKLHVVTEEQYEKEFAYSVDNRYESGMGAEFVRQVLSMLDLDTLTSKLKKILKPYTFGFEDLGPSMESEHKKLYEKLVMFLADRTKLYSLGISTSLNGAQMILEDVIHGIINESIYLNVRTGEISNQDLGEDWHTSKDAIRYRFEYAREQNPNIPVFDKIQEDIRALVLKDFSDAKVKTLVKTLKLAEGFLKSSNRPEWMILTVLPVIPPELRPLVALDGGKFATSDLNDLYRRLINRNNRLKRLIDLDAPDIIVRNEKRMLQESVDVLIDNGKRGKMVSSHNRPLKSLSDYLKGKQGRFRQNLLGKRVDYSGRSVIVVGPSLKMHQCGLPKIMALELFKPFVYRRLEEKGYATSIKNARKMVEQKQPEVWECLEEVVKQHPVLLNRAPTLHRMSIQAFEPVLVEGKAIRLHPLVCPPFNADFDGDQMAVHVPLGMEAQLESYILMLSTQNILSPSNGKPIMLPSQDMVLGLFYASNYVDGVKGEGKVFYSKEEAFLAFDNKKIDIHAKIKVKINDTFVETSVGRLLINEALPKGFRYVNEVLDKKNISKLIANIHKTYGSEITAETLDRVKELGFEMATKAGISIGIEDMKVPKAKKRLVDKAFHQMDEVLEQYRKGIITNKERYNKTIDIWSQTTEDVTKAMFSEIEKSEQIENNKKLPGLFNPIYMMANSGARGNKDQLRQLAGMRGLMAKHSGEFIETPITSNFREGLSVLEYFISTYGARKGLADTALKTSFAGYLTRRLVDVAQDMVITEYDCGTKRYEIIEAIVEGGEERISLKERILGRVLAEDLYDPNSKELIAKTNDVVDEILAEKIQKSGIVQVKARSVLTCESEMGICSMCYGWDLSQRKLVSPGEAVGIIAAQSIGEPGTQLTMRTFHIGGAATAQKVQSELVVENSGKLKFQGLKLLKDKKGKFINISQEGVIFVLDENGRTIERHTIPYAAEVLFKDGDLVKQGDVVAKWDPFNTYIVAEASGELILKDIIVDVTVKEERDALTGKTAIVISFLRAKDAQLHSPRIVIKSEDGTEYAYDLPVNSILNVQFEKLKTAWDKCLACSEAEKADVQHNYYYLDNFAVHPGDIIARIPKETTKVRDIVGGLPRVEELVEARKPKNPAIISEIDGIVKIYEDADEIMIISSKGTKKYDIKNEFILVKHGQEIKEGTKITDTITSDVGGKVIIRAKGNKIVVYNKQTGQERVYSVPKGKFLQVKDGDHVKVGDQLTDGTPLLEEILRIKGIDELQKFLLKEVQMVYKLQGVDINDKHIEIIVRQMLRKRLVVDPGDSRFVVNEEVDVTEFNKEVELIRKEGGKIPKAEPVLVGITRAALSTKSWISAASFQETTRVLTEAASEGKVDDLTGIKENVIIGNLIPAGTGLEEYKNVKLEVLEHVESKKQV